MLDEERAGVADAPAPAPAPASDETPSDSSEPQSTSGVRRIEGPAAEPIDVANLAGAAVAKRAIPAVLAVIVLVLVIRRLW